MGVLVTVSLKVVKDIPVINVFVGTGVGIGDKRIHGEVHVRRNKLKASFCTALEEVFSAGDSRVLTRTMTSAQMAIW